MPAPPEPGPPPGADIWHIRLDADDGPPDEGVVSLASGVLDERERRKAGRIQDAVAAHCAWGTND